MKARLTMRAALALGFSPVAHSPVRSINTILLSDGREVHLDDIATTAEGQAILDDVDAAIDGIESQLDASPPNGGGDPDWRRRRRSR